MNDMALAGVIFVAFWLACIGLLYVLFNRVK